MNKLIEEVLKEEEESKKQIEKNKIKAVLEMIDEKERRLERLTREKEEVEEEIKMIKECLERGDYEVLEISKDTKIPDVVKDIMKIVNDQVGL